MYVVLIAQEPKPNQDKSLIRIVPTFKYILIDLHKLTFWHWESLIYNEQINIQLESNSQAININACRYVGMYLKFKYIPNFEY